MASVKRRRLIGDDGEAERGDVSEGTGDQHAAQRKSNGKRPRRAPAAENGDGGGSDVDSDHQPGSDTREDEEQDGENDREEEIVQEMQKSFNRKDFYDAEKQNQPAEYGVVEEVYCQNFMCHEKLRIKLGPLINFIIGHNGSGKSAVLTALTLCLGVKATATNRGASLKNFIKEGQEHAMLSVKIKNQGDSAYQHDVYGDSIIVERHFSRDSKTSFKIKNADGRLITTKRSDLEDMLDFLGLQLDNPLNVLSQDLARQFLSSSTPKDKYKFFMRGTQLEQLDRDYRMMYDYIDQTEAKLCDRKEDIDVLRRRMESAEQSKLLMDQASSIRQRIANLQWMHAWAQVEAVENDLSKSSANIATLEEDIERKQAVANEKSAIYQNKCADWEAAEAVKLDISGELQPCTAKRDCVKAEFDKSRTLLTENASEKRHINTDKISAEKEVAKYTDLITAEERRIEAASGPAQSAKIEEIETAEAKVNSTREELERLDRKSLDKEAADALAEVTAKAAAVARAAQELTERQDGLRSVQDSRGDEMRGFHRNMPNLLRDIERATNFKHKPIGPLGLHVKLKPEWARWRSIVETIFGFGLEAFIVTNVHDQAALRSLQQRNGITADIFILDPRPVDVTQNEAQPKRFNETYDTLLNILDIDHAIIRKQFIINQTAEQTVLIEKRQEGHRFMFDADMSSYRHNTKTVICMHDSIPNEGIRLGSTANGQKSDRIREWTKHSRIRTNVEDEIRAKQEAVDIAKVELETKRQSKLTSDSRLAKAKKAISVHEQLVKTKRTAHQHAQDRLEELKQDLDKFTVADGALGVLQEQLLEANGELDQHKRTLADANEAHERLAQEHKEIEKRLSEAAKDLDELETRIRKVEAAVAKHAAAKETTHREKNQAFGVLQVTANTRDEAVCDHKDLEARVREFVQEAEQIHPRVPVDPGMTADAIDNKLDKLNAEQNAIEERAGGTREEVIEAWAKARENYRAADKELSSIKAVNDLLKKSLFTRKNRWAQFRRFITARAKFMFAMLLHERGFNGRIIVDHKSQMLDIKVEPDSTQQSDKGRQAKTLSGGEKSFSTICLLLAIWEAMGSPIRCLDEFDVFMDNVNRDISMRMMIQAARRATGKQYVLITPQAMGNVPIDRDVKIHKMSDPERGQTALPY